MSSPPPHLSVLLETSCLSDGRSAAGIGRYARQLRRALGAVAGLDVESLELGPARRESRPGRFLRSQVPAMRMGVRRHPHLVHGVGGEPILGFPLSRQVVTVHDVELWREVSAVGWRGAGIRAHAAVQARLLRSCAAIIAVSESSAREAIETLDLDPSRVHVVPSGVARVFSPTTAPWDDEVLARSGVRSGDYLMWAGTMRHHDPRKALDVLIDAVAKAGGSRPLALVGALGDESVRLAAVARSRGVPTVFVGPVADADLAALYRHASCMVIPSRHEGFGLSALEAMASGCPVVSTDGGNLGALVRGAGIAVPIDDPAALARGINEATGANPRREQLRDLGLDRAATYTWEATAAATVKVYRHAVGLGRNCGA